MRGNDEWILVAVNSWRNTAPEIYSGYVRVTKHRKWIDSVLAGTAAPVDPCYIESPNPQADARCISLGDSGRGVRLETEGPYTWSLSDTWIGEVRAYGAKVLAEDTLYRVDSVETRSGRIWRANVYTCDYCTLSDAIDLSVQEDLACDPREK